MKTAHVRLEYEEAVEGKKQLLSSEVNLLEVLKRLKNYQNLRRQELILKDKLKKEFFALRHEINQVNSSFPEAEENIKIKSTAEKKAKYGPEETKKQKNIEAQLQDIRDKLSKLS